MFFVTLSCSVALWSTKPFFIFVGLIAVQDGSEEIGTCDYLTPFSCSGKHMPSAAACCPSRRNDIHHRNYTCKEQFCTLLPLYVHFKFILAFGREHIFATLLYILLTCYFFCSSQLAWIDFLMMSSEPCRRLMFHDMMDVCESHHPLRSRSRQAHFSLRLRNCSDAKKIDKVKNYQKFRPSMELCTVHLSHTLRDDNLNWKCTMNEM